MKSREGESGYILVTVASLLIVLLGFAALAIDVGALFAARTQSQRAADAAALAGAYTFIQNPDTSDQPARAINNATKVAIEDRTMGRAITAGEVNVTVSIPNRKVTVDIARTEPTFFAKVLNTNNVNVSVQAIAEAAENAAVASCVKPMFVPNTIGAPNGTALCDACNNGQLLVSGTPPLPTVFAPTQYGSLLTLKPGDPADAIGPGNFYAIEMGFPGGDTYRDAISQCSPVQFQCLSQYPVKTGNMIGPTEQGINGHGSNPGLLDTPPDTWVSSGRYNHNGTIYDTSKQLVIAPIADLCGYCPGGNFPQGSTTNLTILGFAVMFVDGMGTGAESDYVKAHLLSVAPCGDPSGGPVVNGSTTLSMPLRLVR